MANWVGLAKNWNYWAIAQSRDSRRIAMALLNGHYMARKLHVCTKKRHFKNLNACDKANWALWHSKFISSDSLRHCEFNVQHYICHVMLNAWKSCFKKFFICAPLYWLAMHFSHQNVGKMRSPAHCCKPLSNRMALTLLTGSRWDVPHLLHKRVQIVLASSSKPAVVLVTSD